MKHKKVYSNKLLGAVKEARKEYRSGKIKSYKDIDSLIIYLEKIKKDQFALAIKIWK